MFSEFPWTEDETNASAALLLLQSQFLVFSFSSSNQISDGSSRIGGRASHEVEGDQDSSSSSSSSSASSSTNASDSSTSVLTWQFGGLQQRDPLLLLVLAMETQCKRDVVRKARTPRIFCSQLTNPWRTKHRSICWQRSQHYRVEAEMSAAVQTQVLKPYFNINSNDGDEQEATSSTITSSRTMSATVSSPSSRYCFRQLVCRDSSKTARNDKRKKRVRCVRTEMAVSGASGSGSRKEYFSKGVCRQAVAIKGLLNGKGSASEVIIRNVLGNSPDTSKALRMLLKQREVTRTGSGGRSDPFLYKVPKCMK